MQSLRYLLKYTYDARYIIDFNQSFFEILISIIDIKY